MDSCFMHFLSTNVVGPSNEENVVESWKCRKKKKRDASYSYLAEPPSLTSSRPTPKGEALMCLKQEKNPKYHCSSKQLYRANKTCLAVRHYFFSRATSIVPGVTPTYLEQKNDPCPRSCTGYNGGRREEALLEVISPMKCDAVDTRRNQQNKWFGVWIARPFMSHCVIHECTVKARMLPCTHWDNSCCFLGIVCVHSSPASTFTLIQHPQTRLATGSTANTQVKSSSSSHHSRKRE